jgi:hypothetical protein
VGGRWRGDYRPQTVAEVTILELVRRFWRYAKETYRHPDGSPSGEAANYRQLLRLVKNLYGLRPAAEVTPKALKAVRHQMIKRGWCRNWR